MRFLLAHYPHGNKISHLIALSFKEVRESHIALQIVNLFL